MNYRPGGRSLAKALATIHVRLAKLFSHARFSITDSCHNPAAHNYFLLLVF
jgi:hypothetical protein